MMVVSLKQQPSFSVDSGAVDGLSEKTTGTSNADLEGDQTVQAVYGFR